MSKFMYNHQKHISCRNIVIHDADAVHLVLLLCQHLPDLPPLAINHSHSPDLLRSPSVSQTIDLHLNDIALSLPGLQFWIRPLDISITNLYSPNIVSMQSSTFKKSGSQHCMKCTDLLCEVLESLFYRTLTSISTTSIVILQLSQRGTSLLILLQHPIPIYNPFGL